MPGRGQHVGFRARDTFVIVIACTANVCRSPHLAALLELELSRCAPEARLIAVTGGVDAASGDPACARLTRLLPAIGPLVSGHRAVPVTAEMLGRADLVVAASREERTRLALLAPEARERMFTAYEAIRLSAGLTAQETAVVPDESVQDRARRLTMSMHRRRAGPAGPARAGAVWVPSQLWDIPDAHTSRARHTTVARHLRLAGRGLAASVDLLSRTGDG